MIHPCIEQQFSSTWLTGLENEPFLVHPLNVKETETLAAAILFLGCLFFARQCFFSIFIWVSRLFPQSLWNSSVCSKVWNPSFNKFFTDD